MRFVSLVTCAAGGYGSWHTHSNVKLLEKRIQDDERELEDSRTRFKAGRIDELELHIRELDKEKAQAELYRYVALAATAISVIPGFMSLAFLAMAVVKFMKKRPPASDDEEENELPTESKSATKKKPKDDDD